MDFTRRLVEGFFRRAILYLLPILLFGALGVISAQRSPTTWVSGATLNASSNPLLEQPEIRGTGLTPFESQAQGTARLINEQLGTDAFVDDVLERAGLTYAMDEGLLDREDIRGAVRAVATGQNFLRVDAAWSDPETAFVLTTAVVEGYLDELSSVAAADSIEAIKYWEQAEAQGIDEVAQAETELRSFLNLTAQTPADEMSVDQEITLLRLQADVTAADAALTDARSQIDGAKLNAEQAQSDAGRGIRLVDDPELPLNPISSRRDQIIMVAMFTMLGVIVSAAALVLSTALDQTVRSLAQLEAVTDVAVIVPLKHDRTLSPKRSRRRSRKAA